MPYHNLVPLFPGRVFNLTIPSGGVQTNFRMPDLFSIGLGGGSIVRPDGDASGGTVRVGPDSVGYAITEEALCFGGSTLTMTDVAVARGMADIGESDRVNAPREITEAAYERGVAIFEEAVDRMKTSAEEVLVIAAGGGSILLPEKCCVPGGGITLHAPLIYPLNTLLHQGFSEPV